MYFLPLQIRFQRNSNFQSSGPFIGGRKQDCGRSHTLRTVDPVLTLVSIQTVNDIAFAIVGKRDGVGHCLPAHLANAVHQQAVAVRTALDRLDELDAFRIIGPQ